MSDGCVKCRAPSLEKRLVEAKEEVYRLHSKVVGAQSVTRQREFDLCLAEKKINRLQARLRELGVIEDEDEL